MMRDPGDLINLMKQEQRVSEGIKLQLEKSRLLSELKELADNMQSYFDSYQDRDGAEPREASIDASDDIVGEKRKLSFKLGEVDPNCSDMFRYDSKLLEIDHFYSLHLPLTLFGISSVFYSFHLRKLNSE